VIADSSAWIVAWRSSGALGERFDELVLNGGVRTTAPVVLELLRGARSPAEHAHMRAGFHALPDVPITAATWRRAADVQGLLASRHGGRHRGVPPIDLLVAAAAEEAGLPVLHRDRDYELIADITGQQVRWFGDPA